jgi:lipid-binding SYLF domain-containing protein
MLAMLPVTVSAPSQAQTTGTVVVQVTKAGFIVGVGGGSGVLTFQGRRYPFSVGGLSLGFTVGASSAEFVGRALNLRSVADFPGTYTAIGGGAAVAGGAGGVRLQNAKGVVLELQGRRVGFEVSVAVSGATITMR